MRAERPDLEIMLNTLAFPASDFGGLDVRRRSRRRISRLLRGSVDRFELMTYLQILNRPVCLAWTGGRGRPAAPLPDRPLCLHAPGRRRSTPTASTPAGGGAPTVTADDLDRSARAALDAGADGLVFYHWTDFLADEAAGGRKRAVLRGLARG